MLILQAPPEPSYAAAERASKMRDYEVLSQIISQWNANRLDLFALTLPNEVRFHFRQIDIIKCPQLHFFGEGYSRLGLGFNGAQMIYYLIL